MTVEELIKELSQYKPTDTVFLYKHGRDIDDEILGCFEDNVYDEDDNVIGTAVYVYEY